VTECLLCKCEALTSDPSPLTDKNKGRICISKISHVNAKEMILKEGIPFN
jgi:hypothetical protein